MPIPRARRRLLATLLTAVVALSGTGCSGGTDEPRAARPTPLGKLKSSTMVVPRITFCDLVPRSAVRQALGGRATGSATWGNGDPIPPAAGATSTGPARKGDFGHEFGCSWQAADGTEVSAWLFARPVTTGFAERVLRQGARRDGCRTPRTSAFGTVSQLQLCRTGDELRVRRAGLFGDAWLSCQLTGPADPSDRAELRKRADAWCVEVVNALDTAGASK